MLIPHGLAQILVGPWAGSLCSRIGSRLMLLVGASINAATMAGIAVVHGSQAALLVAGGILGVGQASALTVMANLIVASVARDEVGIATGVDSVMRTIGMAVGSARSAATLAAGVHARQRAPTEHAYVLASARGVAACATAGGVACARRASARSRCGRRPGAGRRA